DDCPIVPRVPQPTHDIHELARDLVAQIVLVEPFLAEVEGGRIMRAGDDVPGRSAAADMIERGKTARDVERLAETRGHGRAEPDVARYRTQRGKQRHRLE